MDFRQRQDEELIDQRMHRLLAQALGQCRRADDVAEQHGHPLALTFQRPPGSENLLGEVLRSEGLQGVGA